MDELNVLSKELVDEADLHQENENFNTYNLRGDDERNVIDIDDIEGKIFIGGLSWTTTETTLRNYFSAYGELTDVALMVEKKTGKPRGFGFIKLKDPERADVLVEQEHTIDGRVVDVKRALPRDKAPGPTRSESCKVFVGGLAAEVDEKQFGDFFSSFGVVKESVIMVDRNTGRSRGFGFITFEDEDTIELVLNERCEIGGKVVEIKLAEPREARSGGNRFQVDSYGMKRGGRGAGRGGHLYGADHNRGGYAMGYGPRGRDMSYGDNGRYSEGYGGGGNRYEGRVGDANPYYPRGLYGNDPYMGGNGMNLHIGTGYGYNSPPRMPMYANSMMYRGSNIAISPPGSPPHARSPMYAQMPYRQEHSPTAQMMMHAQQHHMGYHPSQLQQQQTQHHQYYTNNQHHQVRQSLPLPLGSDDD